MSRTSTPTQLRIRYKTSKLQSRRTASTLLRHSRVLALWNDGYTPAEVSRQTGLTRKQVLTLIASEMFGEVA